MNKFLKSFVLIIVFTLFMSLNGLAEEEKSKNQKNVEDVDELSLEDLLDVEITSAGKTAQKVSEVPASVVLVTRNDIERFGYMTITEILEHVSGLYNIDTYNDYNGSFGVRGFWSGSGSNIQLLVNNIPQNIEAITIPVQAIDRIEIIRGPMSVIYGSGSMFGAINIITNEASKTESDVIVSTSHGSLNSSEYFGRVSGTKDDFKYSINFGIYSTEGSDNLYSDMIPEADFADFQAFETYFGEIIPNDHSTKKKLEKKYKYFNFYGSFKNFYFSAVLIDTMFDSFFIYPSLSKGVSNEIIHSNFTIGYKKEISNLLTIDWKATYYTNTLVSDYDLMSKFFYGRIYEAFKYFESEIDFIITPSDRISIVSGLNLKTNTFSTIIDVASTGDPSVTNNFSEIKNGDFAGLGSIFTQISYMPIDKLKLIGGIRVEKDNNHSIIEKINGGSTNPNFPPATIETENEAQDALIIPRLAAVYSINKNNVAKIMYGTATNRMDSTLKPEKVSTLEFSYIYSTPKISLNASVFSSTFNDLVITEFNYDDVTQTYTQKSGNFGKMTTLGTELTLITRATDNLYIELGATYQNTKDKNNVNIDVAYSPNLLGQLKAYYKIDKFSFAVTGYYIGEIESYWVPYNPISDTAGHRLGDKIDAYFVLGANIRVDDIYKGLYVNLRMSNLLDQEIRYPVGQNNDMLKKGTLGMGRTFFATIGWKF